jgi:hypothetical protein
MRSDHGWIVGRLVKSRLLASPGEGKRHRDIVVNKWVERPFRQIVKLTLYILTRADH